MSTFVPIGGYGVVMFFVLSGFLLSRPFWAALRAGEAYPSLKTYFLRRFARIVPAFWLALTLSLILGLLAGRAVLNATNIERYVAGLFFVNEFRAISVFPVEINGPLWSISYEVGSYMIMPVAFGLLFVFRKAANSLSRRIALWIAVIAVAIGLHVLYVTTIGILPEPHFGDGPLNLALLGQIWFPRFNVFGMFAIFAIGIMASAMQLEIAQWRSPWADLVAFLALVGIASFLFDVSRPFTPAASLFGYLNLPYNGYPVFPLLLGLFLAFTPSTNLLGDLVDWVPLRYLATISYGIYIYHFLVLYLFQSLLFGIIPASSTLKVYGFLGCVLSATILLAHLSWYRFEKPIIDWARGLERRRRSTGSAPGTA